MHASSAILEEPRARDRATAPDGRPSSVELVACSECGQLHSVPDNLHGPAACARCGATVIEPSSASLATPLVLGLAALPLFAIAMFRPILSIRGGGLENILYLPTAAFAFGAQGFWILTPWVLAIAIGAPLLRCSGLAYVLLGVTCRLDVPGMTLALKLAQHLRKWAMADVFLVGALVAYSRLPAMAGTRIGDGGYALIAAVGVSLAMEAVLDLRGVWRELGSRAPDRIDWRKDWLACADCGALSQAVRTAEAADCWCCGSRLWRRKPYSIGRTLALVVAAMLLYIPAMAWPVMVIDRLGRVEDHTILSGVAALIATNTWPIAVIVFFASIVVPVMKIAGLGLLLVSIRFRWRVGLYERTLLFRVIERIGRWSNIDVFAVGILTALIQFGNFTSVRPGPAVVPFALVVLATMLATHSFDPRLMWDASAVSHVD